MDETYLRVRSAGSQGSFLTRQYLEEVLPQSSFFRRFPVPDLEISSPEESRGEGRARAVLRALGCEAVPLSRQAGKEGLFAVIPGKDAGAGPWTQLPFRRGRQERGQAGPRGPTGTSGFSHPDFPVRGPASAGTRT